MLVKDFIKGPLIREIEDMTIRDGITIHPYLGFQLISSSIEFLGACNKLINLIENRSISGEKVYCHVISTPQD